MVTSASYTFVVADEGHWVYVSAGSNWTPGWYKIASTNAGAATLDAAVGHAVSLVGVPNTVAGCATVASPTSGSWTVDYSQGTGPIVTYDGATNYMTIDGTTNTKMTATGVAFGVNHIGNIVNVTGPAGFTVQRVQIKSIAAGAVTVDKSLGTLGTSNGTGYMGGCFASPGMAGGLMVTGNYLWVKSGTYSIASATQNIATGCVSLGATSKMVGYATVRGDVGTAPLLQASGISTATIVAHGAAAGRVENLEIDGAGLTAIVGLSITTATSHYSRLTIYGCKGGACSNAGSGNYFVLCKFLGVASATVATFSTSKSMQAESCWFDSNGNGKVALNVSALSTIVLTNCIIANATGGTTDGLSATAAGANLTLIRCTFYNSGRDHISVATSCVAVIASCAFETAGTGYDIRDTVGTPIMMFNCASYGSLGTAISGTGSALWHSGNFSQSAGSFFVDAPNGDFRPNATAGRGALLRAAGIGPVLQTNAIDIGAVQHADPITPASLPDAKYVYNAIDRGDGVTGTLRASNIASGAGAPGVDLAATDLKNAVIVDDVTGSYTGGGVIIVED